MDRSLAKFAAALLVGSALSACSTFGGSSPETSAAKQPVKGTTSHQSMAADLNVQIHAAQAQRESGDYAGAIKALGQLMLVTPDDPRVVGEYGKTLVQQGRSREALDFLKRAVQLSPGDWTVYSAMGIAYDQQGDYPNARVAYQQALSIRPGEATVLNNYALSRLQAGDAAGARQFMAQAQASGASNPKIAQNVALVESYAPAKKPVAATPSPVKTAASAGNNKTVPVTVRAMPNVPANVVMQAVPKDSKAGPVREATGAPHQLAKASSSATEKAPVKAVPKSAAPVKAAPSKTGVAAATPKKKAPVAASKTPALRMTADAASP
jgi:Flp pilus assembly protein TadD